MCHSVIELEPHARRDVVAARPTPVRKRIRVPRFVAAAFTGLLSLFATSHAAADSSTGNQDPDYTVAITLASNGQDANTAAPGDTVTATLSVTNDTDSFKSAGARVSVGAPTGFGLSASLKAPMVPRQTVTQKLDFKVPADLPPGTYQWTLVAGDASSLPAQGPARGGTLSLMPARAPVQPEPPGPPGRPQPPVNPGGPGNPPAQTSTASATIIVT